MKRESIYLDYNATTPVDPRVVEYMLPFFSERYGNASSVSHQFGWDAEEAVEIAREEIAELVGVKSKHICFTSGATESINIALAGIFKARQKEGNHIITCQTEHKAVLEVCDHLEAEGADVTRLGVNEYGLVDPDELEQAITKETILISIMYANNETGIIQDLESIAEIAKRHNVIFFCDATQAVGKIPVGFSEGPHIAAFSSHKLYGPKGVGALYLDSGKRLSPVLFGGGQERKIRPGTLNVPGIAGFGKACAICQDEIVKEGEILRKLRDRLEQKLLTLEGVYLNGDPQNRLPHVTNLSFSGVDGTRLIRSLNYLAVSQGSACSSSVQEPSHVLKSMGRSNELAMASLRLSLGRFTTEEEIDQAALQITEALENLRLSTVSERD